MKTPTKILLSFGAASVMASTVSGHHLHLPAILDSIQGGTPAAAGAQAIRYARGQIGCPYVWSGTGPCSAGYDCSGLAMEAYASAGVSIPRTAAEQFAAGPQVSGPVRGGLVFFAGADGTQSAPGHVGIVLGPHRMIEAYAPGVPVRVSTFGLPSSPAGDQSPVGYTDPAGGQR